MIPRTGWSRLLVMNGCIAPWDFGMTWLLLGLMGIRCWADSIRDMIYVSSHPSLPFKAIKHSDTIVTICFLNHENVDYGISRFSQFQINRNGSWHRLCLNLGPGGVAWKSWRLCQQNMASPNFVCVWIDSTSPLFAISKGFQRIEMQDGRNDISSAISRFWMISKLYYQFGWWFLPCLSLPRYSCMIWSCLVSVRMAFAQFYLAT